MAGVSGLPQAPAQVRAWPAPAQVIVVGAGPTGLVLAAELALAGAQVRVLDRRSGLRADSRAICLHARSMEMLDLRGQAGAFTAAGLRCRRFRSGRRARPLASAGWIPTFPTCWTSRRARSRPCSWPAPRAGHRPRWSCEVTGIEQDDHEVRVRLASGGNRAGRVPGGLRRAAQLRPAGRRPAVPRGAQPRLGAPGRPAPRRPADDRRLRRPVRPRHAAGLPVPRRVVPDRAVRLRPGGGPRSASR